MLAWLKRQVTGTDEASAEADESAPRGLGMSRAYMSLHQYLDARFANIVVMTFGEIEDLLGFALPVSARRDPRWWAGDDLSNAAHSNAWLLAKRTATPNLPAQTVVFERGFSASRGSSGHASQD